MSKCKCGEVASHVGYDYFDTPYGESIVGDVPHFLCEECAAKARNNATLYFDEFDSVVLSDEIPF